MRFSVFFLLTTLLGGNLAAAGPEIGAGQDFQDLGPLQAQLVENRGTTPEADAALDPIRVADALSPQQPGQPVETSYTLEELLSMAVAGFPQFGPPLDSGERGWEPFYWEYCKLVRSVVWRLFEGIFEGKSIYTINDLTFFTENLKDTVSKWFKDSHSVGLSIFPNGSCLNVVLYECAYLHATIKKSQRVFDDLVGMLASQLPTEKLEEVRITISTLLTAFLIDGMGVIPSSLEGESLIASVLAPLKALMASLPPKLAIAAAGLVVKFLPMPDRGYFNGRAPWDSFTQSVLALLFNLIRAEQPEIFDKVKDVKVEDETLLDSPNRASFMWFRSAESLSQGTMHLKDPEDSSDLQTFAHIWDACLQMWQLLQAAQSRIDEMRIQTGILGWLADIFGENQLDSGLPSTVEIDMAGKWLRLMRGYEEKVTDEEAAKLQRIIQTLEEKLEMTTRDLENAWWEAQALYSECERDDGISCHGDPCYYVEGYVSEDEDYPNSDSQDDEDSWDPTSLLDGEYFLESPQLCEGHSSSTEQDDYVDC